MEQRTCRSLTANSQTTAQLTLVVQRCHCDVVHFRHPFAWENCVVSAATIGTTSACGKVEKWRHGKWENFWKSTSASSVRDLTAAFALIPSARHLSLKCAWCIFHNQLASCSSMLSWLKRCVLRKALHRWHSAHLKCTTVARINTRRLARPTHLLWIMNSALVKLGNGHAGCDVNWLRLYYVHFFVELSNSWSLYQDIFTFYPFPRFEQIDFFQVRFVVCNR